MKKVFLFLSTILVGLAFITSCSEDDSIEIKKLELSVNDITLDEGQTKEIKALTGNGDYKVSPNDILKATAKGRIISITGIKEGKANIKVTDAKGQTQNISVTINKLIHDISFGNLNDFSLPINTSKKFSFTGGSGDFDVKSVKEDIATAKIVNGKLVITAKNAGATVITITDKKTKKTKSFPVTITATIADIAVKTKQITILKNNKEVIEITAGSGKYTATPTATDIVKADIKGNVVELKGLKKGETKVTIKDTQTQKETTINVTVSVDALVINKATTTIKKGSKENVTITAGSGKYTIVSENPQIATVEYTNGEKLFNIVAVAKGETKITVTDTEANTSKEVNVTVTINPLTLNQTEVTIEKSKTATIVVTSSSGEFTAVPTDENIATLTKNDKNIVITGVKNGTTEITVTDADNQKQVINVTVAVEALTLAETETEFDLTEGKSLDLHIIKGSGHYEITGTTPQILEATLNGNTIKINSKFNSDGKLYEATPHNITITDTETKVKKDITINVFKKLSLARLKDKVMQGEIVQIFINSGDLTKIELDNKDKAIADAVIQQSTQANYGHLKEVKITTKKPGVATIIVKENDSDVEKTIVIEVEKAPALKVLDFNYSEITNITLSVGEDQQAPITIEGSNQYDITFAEPLAEIVGETSGGFLQLNPLKGGITTMTITDRVTGDSKTINLTIKAAPFSFTYFKDGNEIQPDEYDTDETPWFNVKVGDIIKIKVSGGSGEGYMIVTEGGETTAVEYSSGVTDKLINVADSEGNFYVDVKMLAVASQMYFNIKDSDGNKAKYFGFKITQDKKNEETTENKNYTDVTLLDDGTVRRKTFDEKYSGDIILSPDAKIIRNDEWTLFNGNKNISSIDFGGVTTIEPMSLMGCTGLTSIILRNVTKVGRAAFFNNKNLKDVYCHMTTPTKLQGVAFKNIHPDAVLHIPSGTKQKYIEASYGDYFTNIVEE